MIYKLHVWEEFLMIKKGFQARLGNGTMSFPPNRKKIYPLVNVIHSKTRIYPTWKITRRATSSPIRINYHHFKD